MFEDLLKSYKNKYGELKYDDRAEVADNSANFQFIPLEPGTVMPFDEVVLYDPRNGRLASGYVQLTFDQHPTPQTVYIDLPKSTIEVLVRKLDARRTLHLDSLGDQKVPAKRRKR
jgi:hypothetical protein